MNLYLDDVANSSYLDEVYGAQSRPRWDLKRFFVEEPPSYSMQSSFNTGTETDRNNN